VTAGVSRVCEKDRVWMLIDVSILNKQDSVNHQESHSLWVILGKERVFRATRRRVPMCSSDETELSPMKGARTHSAQNNNSNTSR